MSATKEWHFFYDHAPFSFNRAKETQLEGRMRCANELMMAEEYAKESDWEYDWDIDPDAEPVDPADKDEAGEALYCRLVNRHGLVLESLYGIWEPTKEYRRVVEAELALEAMARELGMARPCGQCGRPVSKGPVGYDEECRCAEHGGETTPVPLTDDDLCLLITGCDDHEGQECFEELGRRLRAARVEFRVRRRGALKR